MFLKSSGRELYFPECPRMTSELILKVQKTFEQGKICYFKMSYFSSGVNFQKSLLVILKNVKIRVDNQIFKTFWPQGVKKSNKTADKGGFCGGGLVSK